MSDPTPTTELEARLVALEQQVRSLNEAITKLDLWLQEAAGLPTEEPVAAAQVVPSPPPKPVAPPKPAPPIAAAVITPHASQAAAPEPTKRGVDLEHAVTGRGLSILGGVALILGAMFFLSLAFSRGWIGPTERVVIGLVGGAVAFGAGTWLIGRRDQLLGRVLTAVGIGVWDLAVVAGVSRYHLIASEMGLLLATVGAVAAVAVAIRYRTQLPAVLGLMTALLAPIMVGGSIENASIFYLVVVLAATTTLTIRMGWTWIPPTAFVLSVLQVIIWEEGRPTLVLGISVVLIVWTLHAIATTSVALKEVHPLIRMSMGLVAFFNAIMVATAADALRVIGLRDWGIALLYTVLGLAYVAMAIAVRERQPLAGGYGLVAVLIGTLLFGGAIVTQFDGLQRLAASCVVAIIAIAAIRIPLTGNPLGINAGPLGRFLVPVTMVPAIAASAAAVFAVVTEHARLSDALSWERVTFPDEPTIAVGLLVAASVAIAVLIPMRWRSIPAAIGLMAVWLLLPFELHDPWVMAGWAAIGVVAVLLGQRLGAHPLPLLVASVIGFVTSMVFGIVEVAPPARLVVAQTPPADWLPLWQAVCAFAVLILGLAIVGRQPLVAKVHNSVIALAGAFAVYLGSVARVAFFQARVMPGRPVQQVAKQAQLALSISWGLLGGALLAAGVVRFGSGVRLFGLGLLGLAAAKVFVYDLASLDAAYRVLSFIMLGALLLASSFAYRHLQPRPAQAGGAAPGQGAHQHDGEAIQGR